MLSLAVVSLRVCTYGFALWLGLYLIVRDRRSVRLRMTGLGLIAYALALACDLVAGVAQSTSLALLVTELRSSMLLLPPLFWIGALIDVLPEGFSYRHSLVRLRSVALPPAAALLVLLSFGAGSIGVGGRGVVSAIQFIIAAIVLLPMLTLVRLVWRSVGGRRTRQAAGILVVVTLFFGLSTAFVIFRLGWLPPLWRTLTVGVDLVALGVAIAYFDAFDQGETLLADMLRSLVAALLSALVFGGQVALVIAFVGGINLPVLLVLLACVASAIAVPTAADPIGNLLDRVTLARRPRVQAARAEMRAVSAALPRANPALDPASIDMAEFERLTRRALSHFGDLPRLASSPLTQLPLVDQRLAKRGASGDALERAAELKALLVESIDKLKPRNGGDFGTSDEWRHFNAVYFPYVAGLKPYSRRVDAQPDDPAVREALEWFRVAVPERTLYNWQTAAAKLIARDLRSRNDSHHEDTKSAKYDR